MNTIILKLILKFVADSCFDIKLSDDNGKYKCVNNNNNNNNNKCGRTNPGLLTLWLPEAIKQLLIPTKSIHYLGNMYWED